MWWTKLLLIGTVVAVSHAHASVNCPLSLRGHKLSEIDVLNGPVLNPAAPPILVPDATGWDLAIKPGWTGPGFFVLCNFSGTTETITVPVPRSITRCDLPAHGYLRLICR